jgi:hypothetical protein
VKVSIGTPPPKLWTPCLSQDGADQTRERFVRQTLKIKIFKCEWRFAD